MNGEARPIGYFRALWGPMRGVGFLVRNPSLVRFLILPWMITFGATALLVYLVFDWGAFYPQLRDWIWDAPTTGWRSKIYFLWEWTLGIGLALACMLGGFVIGQLVASPIYTRLSMHTRRRYLADGVDAAGGWYADLLNPVLIQLGRVIVFLLVQGALLWLWLIPFIGGVMHVLFGTLATLLFLSLDFFDYPLDSEPVALPVARRIAYVNANLPMALGFSTTMLGILSIPVLGLLMMPVGVVGATLLYCDQIRATGPPTAEA